MELTAMSIACRELRNRKRQKIINLSNYMRDVDSRLQVLTEAIARREQRAGTSATSGSASLEKVPEPEMTQV